MDVQFTATLQKAPTRAGGRMSSGPNRSRTSASAGSSNSRRDRRPFRSSFMARGDGPRKLPVKADVRKLIGKKAGDRVTIRLEERLD